MRNYCRLQSTPEVLMSITFDLLGLPVCYRRSICFLQVYLYTTEAYLYTTDDLWCLLVYCNRFLRPSCTLQSTSKGFLYITYDLHVYYSRTVRPFSSILQSILYFKLLHLAILFNIVIYFLIKFREYNRKEYYRTLQRFRSISYYYQLYMKFLHLVTLINIVIYNYFIFL